MYQSYFAGFRDELPYIIVFVQLAEGPMMMANLVNSVQGAVRCDAPVEIVFFQATPEISLPQFRLIAGRT
jgi:uncharacterized OB-fold protein